MTWPQDTPPPPARHEFDAKEFFASFMYGLGAFMGVAAIIGAVIAVYLFVVFDKLS